jgi:hypothetical protein
MSETDLPTAERPEKRGRLKKAVAKAAPKIAEQLGGPLAGAAVAAIARAIFGKEHVGEEELADAVAILAQTRSSPSDRRRTSSASPSETPPSKNGASTPPTARARANARSSLAT